MTDIHRQVFYSFHYNEDKYRAALVRNMGLFEGERKVADNDWEEVKKKGVLEIKQWINNQLEMRSCTVVLVSYQTASRPWVIYEIKRSWLMGKGVVGIDISKLKTLHDDTFLIPALLLSGYPFNPFERIIFDEKSLYPFGYKSEMSNPLLLAACNSPLKTIASADIDLGKDEACLKGQPKPRYSIPAHGLLPAPSQKLSHYVEYYHPRGNDSRDKYHDIEINLRRLVETAIDNRNRYRK